MIKYIIKKISYGIVVLFGVITVIFLLFNVLPADPARMMLDERESSTQLELIDALEDINLAEILKIEFKGPNFCS